MSAFPTLRLASVLTCALIVGVACGSDPGSSGGSGGTAGLASGGSAGSAVGGSGAMGGSGAIGGSSAGTHTAGSAGSAAGGAGGSAGGTGACFDTSSAYPAGPYGIQEGEVVANLELEGYVNLEADAVSSTKPYQDYSLEALRQTGRCYALVHVSEFF